MDVYALLNSFSWNRKFSWTLSRLDNLLSVQYLRILTVWSNWRQFDICSHSVSGRVLWGNYRSTLWTTCCNLATTTTGTLGQTQSVLYRPCQSRTDHGSLGQTQSVLDRPCQSRTDGWRLTWRFCGYRYSATSYFRHAPPRPGWSRREQWPACFGLSSGWGGHVSVLTCP